MKFMLLLEAMRDIAMREKTMYHKGMTIKRRLFISNIRMVILTGVSFWLAGYLTWVIFNRQLFPGGRVLESLNELMQAETQMTVPIILFVLFIIIIGFVNNVITYLMIRKIIKPLVPLNDGVKEIQANNFSYRIDYKNKDEFRPVCDAFNEMASKLELSTAQRLKDEANRRELITGISHDLRTPLTSIIGCVEGIQTGVASTPEMQEKYLNFIKSEAENMKHIIEQLFLFSKLDMEEFPLNMMRVNINLAVCEMIEDSISGYKSRGLSIHVSEIPHDVYVMADVRLFRSVIINILENSVKYKTKEYGNMEISAELMNNTIRLKFADDGPGVEPDILPKLFNAFYRSDPSRNDLGSGLGLAISVKIIQSMGGRIYAQLPPLGGLTVIIQFPVLQGDIN